MHDVGAVVEEYARRGNPHKYGYSIPMKQKKNMSFSFSGLKTSVKKSVEAMEGTDLPIETKCDVAASFQHAAFEHLAQRIVYAFEKCKETNVIPSSLVVSGGVAANVALRNRLEMLSTIYGVQLVVPPPSLCCDNGVMIGWAAIEKARAGSWSSLATDIIQKWPLNELEP